MSVLEGLGVETGYVAFSLFSWVESSRCRHGWSFVRGGVVVGEVGTSVVTVVGAGGLGDGFRA
jgi:hypothetical protein